MTRLLPLIAAPLLLLLAALLLGGLAVPAGALSSWRPDVLILVAAAASGQDQIGVTYAGKVPSAQAHRDLAALRAVTGWTLRRVRVSDGPSPVKSDRAQMTEADCYVTHVVRPETHGLDVLPFVRAFRPYSHVILTFFVGAGFEFEGLRGYADKDVAISLDRHSGAYTYRIFIRNPRFGRLNLPYLQPVPPDNDTRPELVNCARRRNRLCQEHL